MAKIDPERLRADPLWNRKINRSVRASDTNKNGLIERADMMMIVSNYKSLSSATPAFIDSLTKSMESICQIFGLVDDSVQLTYEQFKEKWASKST